MTPEEFALFRREYNKLIDFIYNTFDSAKEQAENSTPPKNFRKAELADFQIDAVIWYKDGNTEPVWKIVDEVISKDLKHKYYDHESRPMFLDGAFINIGEG